MKKVMRRFALIVTLVTVFASCSDDDSDPEVINEEETITTVRLSVTESGTTDTEVYTWTTDSQDDITLSANTTYNFAIEFLDESDPSDVEDITEEVIDESDEHYVFYDNTVNELSFVAAADDVVDADNISINISTDWSTGDAATGILRAFLIHEPTTKTGDTRDDFGGETDIEVSFDVTVE
ncbi:hypothetical protein GCM10022393_36010 [Aquimarina addita]|uniref:Type 1 periplasmic binding fold superfamily protein n=1 Tax=Aquimarina addita TaxID=870485 RepID=A0ABP6UQY1_9FLAO